MFLVLSVLDPALGRQLSEATVGDFLATALFFCNIMPFLKPARLGTPTPLHVSHQQIRRTVNCSGPTRLCNLDRLLQLLPVSSHHWSCRLLLYGRRKMSVPQNTHKVPSVVVRETRSGRWHQFVLIFVWFIFQLTLRAHSVVTILKQQQPFSGYDTSFWRCAWLLWHFIAW